MLVNGGVYESSKSNFGANEISKCYLFYAKITKCV